MRAGRSQIAILVVTCEPDDRPSTVQLRAVLRALDATPGVRTDLWYLRAGPDGRSPDRDGRFVDDLRRWPPFLRERRFDDHPAVRFLRGRRLDLWYWRVRPLAVLLDDGAGHRVIPRLARPLLITRTNPTPPATLHLEAGDLIEGDDIVTGPTAAPAPAPDRPSHAEGKDVFGLPPDRIVVSTWPGPTGDTAIARLLALLDDVGTRLGQPVDGVTFAPGATAGGPGTVDTVPSGGRLHHRGFDTAAARACSDVAWIDGAPDRTDDAAVTQIERFGTPVVVADDHDAAVAGICRAVTLDRDEVRVAADRRSDPVCWADDLLAIIDRHRSREERRSRRRPII